MKLIHTTMLLLLITVPGLALEVEGFTPDKTVVYKKVGPSELKIHIFTPANHTLADKRPAIVFFFGGGWNGGSPTQFYPHCDYLASRGMVAMSAEYRVKTRHGTSPRECVKDGKTAIRWIRVHSDELGIDPNKLAAGGGSAGGHVAAATATVKGFNEEGEDQNISCKPNALVLFNPVFDNSPGGYGYDRVKEYWKDFSPMHNIIESTPPTIVFLGTKDKLIPTATAEQYRKLMADKGRRCDLHFYKNQEHGFFNYRNKKYFTTTVVEADRFLASLGYVKGEPTLQNKPDPGDNE
ncbi:MAG: alpha/beta hydrolase [Planctomycetota bacterium]|jgi:acetyl esterase/lipase